MVLRRWLFAGAALCAAVASATLALALGCIFDLIGGQCELWFLGPLVTLPLALGMGLIGRAASQPTDIDTIEIYDPRECSEREEA